MIETIDFEKTVRSLVKASSRNDRAKIETLLRAQPDAVVRKLFHLMYVGRGDVDMSAAGGRELRGAAPTIDIAISVMLEKGPLGTYLDDGLAFADREGIDLDEWAST